MLQISIFHTLQKNLANIDYSVLLVGVMTIADEIDSQLSQAIARYTSWKLFRRRLCPASRMALMSAEDGASFQFLAENSTDVICRAGADAVLHYVSPSSFRVLGWKPEEMTGKRPDDFILSEDASFHSRPADFGPRGFSSHRTHAQERRDDSVD